jgi:hypothetical protein
MHKITWATLQKEKRAKALKKNIKNLIEFAFIIIGISIEIFFTLLLFWTILVIIL